jgi:poly-beta-1,6-N-acetyl-D-glucosamine biosynthesis protein PgaD
LITGGNVPTWMRVRDVVLTLIAWVVLGWLLRDALYLAYDYLRPPLFELTARHPELIPGLERLSIFLAIAVGLVACLVLLTLGTHRRLRTAVLSLQPPSLSVAEQAARAGVEERVVTEARGFKIAIVAVREDGSISEIGEAAMRGEVPASVRENPLKTDG